MEEAVVTVLLRLAKAPLPLRLKHPRKRMQRAYVSTSDSGNAICATRAGTITCWIGEPQATTTGVPRQRRQDLLPGA